MDNGCSSDKDWNKVQNFPSNAINGGDVVDSTEFQGHSNVMGFKSRLRTNMSRKGAGLSRLQIREIADCAELDRADSVGAALKAARLRLDKDTALVARDLKIRRDYIEALELGQFELLPSMIYVRGFVRSYAQYLGLDAEECLFRFKAETSEVTMPKAPAFLEPKPEVRLPQGSMFILAALLAAGLYGGWFLSVAADRMVIERVPPVPSAGYSDPGESGPSLQPRPPSAVGGPDLQVRPLQDVGNEAFATIAVDNGRTIVLGRPEDVITLESLFSGEAAIVNEVVSPGLQREGQKFGDIQGKGRLVLRARAPAWIRVEDEASQVLIQRELREGDQYFAPNQPGLILSARDAGALEVIIDGTLRGVLGNPGQPLPAVSLDVSLEPEGLVVPDPS